MKKQLLAMFLAMGLLASGIPHTAWAKNPEDNVKTLDSAVDVQQALHANGPEAKGTKENVSDTQEQVSARVIFKNHILPEKTYGTIEKFYYSAGEYYILKYQNGEAAKEAVKKLKGDYPGTLVVQDRIVSIKTEDEPQTEEPENADTPSQKEGEEESSPENNEDSKATPKSNGEGENAQEDAQEEEDDSQAEARNLYFPFPYNGAKSMGLDKLKESRNWGTGEVKVAVIDSGINKVNEYFTNRIDERNSVNFAVDSPNQPENYGDIYGHGSHVAGIITKSTPENVKIMAIRVFDVTITASLSTINLGIHHADEHDADIINLSLGQLKVKEEEEDFINEAMETAVKHNRTCIVAAGNEKMDAEGSFPARSGWGITIGSYEEQGKKPEKKPNLGEKDPLITDENDPDLSFTTKPTYNKDSFIHSWFSNYGKRLDFVAPGKYIRSAWAPYPNNRAFDPEMFSTREQSEGARRQDDTVFTQHRTDGVLD